MSMDVKEARRSAQEEFGIAVADTKDKPLEGIIDVNPNRTEYKEYLDDDEIRSINTALQF